MFAKAVFLHGLALDCLFDDYPPSIVVVELDELILFLLCLCLGSREASTFDLVVFDGRVAET